MACDVCLGINSALCPVCGRFPDMVECPDCGGAGGTYWALNTETGEEIEVTPQAFACLPRTKSAALARGARYMASFFEKCDRCGGTGVVEDVYEPDPDEYHERIMERGYYDD